MLDIKNCSALPPEEEKSRANPKISLKKETILLTV